VCAKLLLCGLIFNFLSWATPHPRYTELEEAFRRQYARTVAKPMDLRSVRDRLLGRADAGAAARASQAFFLRGRLDAGKEKASNMGSCAHNATHIIFLFIFCSSRLCLLMPPSPIPRGGRRG